MGARGCHVLPRPSRAQRAHPQHARRVRGCLRRRPQCQQWALCRASAADGALGVVGARLACQCGWLRQQRGRPPPVPPPPGPPRSSSQPCPLPSLLLPATLPAPPCSCETLCDPEADATPVRAPPGSCVLSHDAQPGRDALLMMQGPGVAWSSGYLNATAAPAPAPTPEPQPAAPLPRPTSSMPTAPPPRLTRLPTHRPQYRPSPVATAPPLASCAASYASTSRETTSVSVGPVLHAGA